MNHQFDHRLSEESNRLYAKPTECSVLKNIFMHKKIIQIIFYFQLENLLFSPKKIIMQNDKLKPIII